MSVRDRLGRLLFIVPYVASRDGVPVAELASMLGITPAQLRADVDLLSMVGRPPLTPDHLIDLYIEDDVVYVDLDQSLSRPLRLTHDEAASLVLAAGCLEDTGGIGAELGSVIRKIASHLTDGERAMVERLSRSVGLPEGRRDATEPAAVIRRAIAEHRVVHLDYYAASSDRERSYRLAPLALVAHEGLPYLVARDLDADGQEKLFRLDRIGSASLADQRFDAPVTTSTAHPAPTAARQPPPAFSALVRFAREIASEAIRRFDDRVVERSPDGDVLVRLETSSPAWLARWVLPFGTRAEVIAPAEARQAIRDLTRRAAEAYRRALP